jgi:hypothetical protein
MLQPTLSSTVRGATQSTVELTQAGVRNWMHDRLREVGSMCSSATELGPLMLLLLPIRLAALSRASVLLGAELATWHLLLLMAQPAPPTDSSRIHRPRMLL